MEKLAYESELGSKGHLSSIERGLVMVTVKTLRTIADGLGVHPADLLVSPEDGPREAVLEASRHVSPEMLARWIREAGDKPSSSARTRSRRT